jgi:hypothetical protein
MQDKRRDEQGSGAANGIVLFAKILLTLFLLCVLVGGGVCGICIGMMDVNKGHGGANGGGVELIIYTLMGIAVIAFIIWLMWRKKKPSPQPEEP